MRALVTGAAGFIGSRLAAHLLDEGHEVTGLDCFTPYYDTGIKRSNLTSLSGRSGFEFREADLRTDDVAELATTAEVIFHLAAQPGVRSSWGEGFDLYAGHNLLATQRLLESARRADSPSRIVFASSSSVYGDAETYPTSEDAQARPVSPYGVTKLAAEHLVDAYRSNFGIQATVLRYFTVYGPGQRPDMAFTRFIEAALHGQPLEVFGDGEQTRDVTYVDDVVRATAAAASAGAAEASAGAQAINIAGGSQVTVNRAIELIGELTGKALDVNYKDQAAGDVRRTGGDISRAREILDFKPQVSIDEGLALQVEWLRNRKPASR